MAFTADGQHATTTEVHAIEMQARGETRSFRLPERQNDYLSSKGDLWKIPMNDFHFSQSCIYFQDIQRITIVERSLDGWHVDSIATFVKDTQGRSQLASVNLDANRWIDGDGHHSRRRFDLTLIR